MNLLILILGLGTLHPASPILLTELVPFRIRLDHGLVSTNDVLYIISLNFYCYAFGLRTKISPQVRPILTRGAMTKEEEEE